MGIGYIMFMKNAVNLATSESVSQGHPDKVADLISDSLLDYFLVKSQNARVALETMVVSNRVIVGGEVSFCINELELDQVVRSAVSSIHYENNSKFNSKDIQIEFIIGEQSEDIVAGLFHNGSYGAGDQGTMYGYATNEIPSMIPASAYYSHAVLKSIMGGITSGDVVGLGMDAKSQVTVKYIGNRPVGVKNIVLSIQHDKVLSQKEVRKIVLPYIMAAFPSGWMCSEDDIFVNPTGVFTIGGPMADCGLTGRKIMVDTYGGFVPHGGGAFSGKDPSKVDRSAAYMARYIAKNIVSSMVATHCLVKLSYAIGHVDPLDFSICTFGTSKVPDKLLADVILSMISISPGKICDLLSLRAPIYAATSCYGHFGRRAESNFFTWESSDLAEVIKHEFESVRAAVYS